MKMENAQRILKAGDELGHEIRLYPSYRGRGMSSPTTGVVGSRSAIIQSVAAAAADLGLRYDGTSDEVDEFIKDMDLSFDAMGLNQIAY